MNPAITNDKILLLTLEGYSAAEVADTLSISISSVYNRLRHPLVAARLSELRYANEAKDIPRLEKMQSQSVDMLQQLLLADDMQLKDKISIIKLINDITHKRKEMAFGNHRFSLLEASQATPEQDDSSFGGIGS